MTLRVLSMAGTVLDTQADAVIFPGLDGSIGIHPGHAPMISAMQAGELRYRREGEESVLSLPGGILEIANDVITIITDSEAAI